MHDIQTISNTCLDRCISNATNGQGDMTPELDLLFEERSRRISARQAEIAEAEAAWEAEIDALIEQDRQERREKAMAEEIKVVLTSTQATYLDYLLPMDYEETWALRVSATRVYGTREVILEAYEFIRTEADTMVQYALENANYSDPDREEFIERQALKCFKGLCGKLRRATRVR